MNLRLNQDLINLNDVPEYLSCPVTPQSVKRWARLGCGGVKLDSIKIGNLRCTTLIALEEFSRLLTEARDGVSPQSATAPENSTEAVQPPSAP